jgi:hypothetical protein
LDPEALCDFGPIRNVELIQVLGQVCLDMFTVALYELTRELRNVENVISLLHLLDVQPALLVVFVVL